MDQSFKRIIDNLAKVADEARKVLEAYERLEESGKVPPPDQPETTAPDYSEEIRPDVTSLPGSKDQPEEEFIACTPKQLPKKLLVQAAKDAIQINPANAPFLQGPMAALGATLPPLEPLHIAVLTSKYWGPQQRQLTVSFMEPVDVSLRDRILSHMNAWHTGKPGCGIEFVWTQGTGDIRISRGAGGYWSYLGTDNRQIPQNRQTMNLQGFTMQTRDSEFYRVVRHETGHAMGAPHEHMRREIVERLDPARTIAYFRQNQGWDAQTVQQQVLTPLDERSLMSTPVDQTSIMCYQLDSSITRDGKPIPGGLDINPSDYAFMAKVYPLPGGEEEEDLDWLV